MSDSSRRGRRELVERLFPQGVPKLWCPPLTHYRPDGGLDRPRMAAHLATLAPYAKGWLVPGSTGDAWELDETEARQVLECVLDLAPALGVEVLVGALKPDAGHARRVVVDTLAWLRERTGCGDDFGALRAAGVCGFAFCPPAGSARSQAEIRDGLASILELGLPSALYQLPQVTGNEMAPATVAELAERFSRLYLFKDSSGADGVATSGLDLGGVALLRGAECDYHRWLASNAGTYHGFLLSTANCFARQLHEMIDHLDQGRVREGQALSELLSRAIAGVFELVDPLPLGNRYTNANKAIDHFLAHGPSAAGEPPPRLHAGVGLPGQVVAATGALLTQLGLMPPAGYLGQ